MGGLPAAAPGGPTLAVVGAGWAGLAAAVEATRLGHRVRLVDMAPQAGGRAREVADSGLSGGLDNGQHILIGAYTETLALMRRVGADPDQLLLRRPLSMAYPDGDGLLLPAGAAVQAFLRAVMAQHRWPWAERLALLREVVGWRLAGFCCPPQLSVAQLTHRLPARIREVLIDPLCVAALNTPSTTASATVFLRVMRDALFAGPGAADLLLPRVRLSALLPTPALHWLRQAGARLDLGERVQQLERAEQGWRLSTSLGHIAADRVILACTSTEAARLAQPHQPAWAATAQGLRHEPITTLSLHSPGTRLSLPMLALRSDEHTRPGQFVFDQGQLCGQEGLLSLVISGAAPWVERGSDATVRAAIGQLQTQLGPQLKSPLSLVKLLTDKRATFSCTPGLVRPAMQVSEGLLAAGDYIAGPYPATLEGAVRSGMAAARALS